MSPALKKRLLSSAAPENKLALAYRPSLADDEVHLVLGLASQDVQCFFTTLMPTTNKRNDATLPHDV
ncbi:hypothetical protein NDU88_002268 [Pleurodeles waltl]|uniref:Uncharacterized protein n=1 Tax=Pleurodeles waltl TaxID=8319 RepID=A0AAV7W1X1_PLEWA|nr:hypothetical protein NDU88_002268 [Pleurodeles waltl]